MTIHSCHWVMDWDYILSHLVFHLVDIIAPVHHRSITLYLPIIHSVHLLSHEFSPKSVYLLLYWTSALHSLLLSSTITVYTDWLFSAYAFHCFPRCTCCKLSAIPYCHFLSLQVVSSADAHVDSSSAAIRGWLVRCIACSNTCSTVSAYSWCWLQFHYSHPLFVYSISANAWLFTAFSGSLLRVEDWSKSSCSKAVEYCGIGKT